MKENLYPTKRTGHMPFAPAAERPGLRTQKLKVETATTMPSGWILERDFRNRLSPQPKSIYVDCWFRRGTDFMKAWDSAAVHCKFGDEHLGNLDPANPKYTDLLADMRVNTEYSDGTQWGPKLLLQWCEFTGMIVDGLKISHGMQVEDCYIHDLLRLRTDFYTDRGNPGDEKDFFTHNDAIQCLQAPAQYGPVAVKRSLIVMRSEHMSAFMIQPVSADINEFIIEGNYLSARQVIFAISRGSKGILKKIVIRNNVFSKKSVEWALVGRYLDRQTTQVVWEGNAWDDGKPITLEDALKNPTPR